MSNEINNVMKPIWRTMNTQEIDKQYSPSKWSKRYSSDEVIKVHIKVAKELSDHVRLNIPGTLNISYSSKERTKLDVFGQELSKDSYILMYVHGGYWQELEKDLSLYLVGPLYKKGIITVVVGYTLAPKASLSEIVEEIRLAVKWCCDLAKKRGSKGVVLMGFSAGGHLITEVLSTKKETDKNDTNIVKGFITLSGVFDVRPLVQIYVNEPLSLNEDSAWDLSPLGKADSLARDFGTIKSMIAVGENDSPEFKRQSEQYCQVLKKNNMKSRYEEIKDADHFNLVEDLAKPDYDLTIKIIEFINTL